MTIKRKIYLRSGIITVIFWLLVTFLSGSDLQAQGSLVYKNASDTTWVYCLADSTGWLGFPPGCMQGGMGMMFPDSIYCIYQETELDSLPGKMDSTFCQGYHIDISDSSGHGMMDQGMMSFNESICLQVHYDPYRIGQKGWSESGITLRCWDKTQLSWTTVSGMAMDTLKNLITVFQNPVYQYYVVIASTPAGVSDGGRSSSLPGAFELYQNYPNPFNPKTTIQFKIESSGFKAPIHTDLSIYNILGQRIRTLLNENKLPGEYKVVWDGKDNAGNSVSSGIYFYKLKSGNLDLVRKMLLMK